ncbi:hypothetical protein FGG08_005805 [Glutinoglossum americanum]|uniref:Carboxymuconolactone decarboxylase-like domain-containing protein n=1 Tax=Glutinoglossum americanum TaxID=1670608 RepID=A0A9P8I2K7_9PEZI|nr:hypothetical protein FGG08_005805 [Glutinoglossum americanum]
MSPPILTPSLLLSLRKTPYLPKHTWYFITGITLTMLNRAEEIPGVFRCAVEEVGEGEEGRKMVVRRMREGLVKSVAVGGLPKVINALLLLKSSTPPSLLDFPPDPTIRNPLSSLPDPRPATHTQSLDRGLEFWSRTYGKIARRVMDQLDNSGTPDLGAVARLMYGYLISKEGILTPKESSFCLMAGLVPQDVNPQLKGHLKGALNNGATVEEVRAVRDVVIRICEAAGMKRLGDGAVAVTNEIEGGRGA